MRRKSIFVLSILFSLCLTFSCKKDIEAHHLYYIIGKWEYYKIGDIDGPLALYQHSAGCAKDFIEFGKASGTNYPFCEEFIFDANCNAQEHNKLNKGIGGHWLISNEDMLTRYYSYDATSGAYQDRSGRIFFAEPDYYQIIESNKSTLKLHLMGEGKIKVIIFKKM